MTPPRRVSGRLAKQELLALREARGPCVSLYLRTHRAGKQIEQDRIRLKNLLGSAEEQLRDAGIDKGTIGELLGGARALIDDAAFWRHQTDGLAILCAKGVERIYHLPIEPESLAVVHRRFHLKPLLPLLTEGGRFYVLAISRNLVRMFEATPGEIHEIDLGEAVPQSLADALGHDWEQRSLQMHAQSSISAGSRSIFHGHGSPSDDRETELRRFLEILDRGLREYVPDTDIPWVLAGVEENRALFRQVSRHPRILDRAIETNPDELSPAEVHRLALEAARPELQADREAAKERFLELRGTDRASAELDEIVIASYDGRVDFAFVPVDRHAWGQYDPEERRVERRDEPSPESQDLLDTAAIQVLAHGGTVYAVEPDEMPDSVEIAAVFRY